MSIERLPTVHVFEPSHLGHRPLFLAWLLNDPPDSRRWLLHTTSKTLDHPAIRPLFSASPANLTSIELSGCPSEPQRKSFIRLVCFQIAKLVSFRRNWRRHARSGDVAFIPYYDDLSAALFLLPWLTLGMPLVTLGMRAQFHQLRQGIRSSGRQRGHAVKEFLLRRLLDRRGTRCYLTNQLPLKRDVDSRWGRLAAKVRFYPDPAERAVPIGKTNARQQLGLASERHHVLCYGNLTARKGVDHLLAAVADPSWPGDATAIFAGNFRDEIADLLSTDSAQHLVRRGLIRCMPGFVDPATENLLFQAADAVWMVYDGHDFMSGCLVTAGMHGRPAIGCTTGLIAWYIEKYSGGLLYDPHPDRREEELAALNALLHDQQRLASHGEGLRRAFANHTIGSFRTIIFDTVLTPGRSEKGADRT